MPVPIGPLFAGGNQDITKSGYVISYWPDAHNDLLQRAGQAPVYYWLPQQVRLAKQDNGDYKFSMIHFVGIRSSDTTVGETSTDNEVAGGLLTFSTVAAPAADVLQQAHNDLISWARGNGNPYWNYFGNQPPNFTFVPIVSNTCALSNTLPGADGTVPAAAPGKALNGSGPPAITAMRSFLPAEAPPPTVPVTYRGSNIDPMFVKMDGQGPGTIDPNADKAFSALLGSIPAAVVYNGFHLGTGPLFVTENMMIRVVSPLMTIDITGDWSRVQDHFSAAAHAGGLWWSADIQAQYDSLRESGDIQVHTFVDQSLPGADKLQDYMDKRSNMVFQKFMDLAKQAIFDPAPFNEQPAQASGGFLGFGGGGALKLRTQRTSLSLDYHETREIAYLQPFQITGTLDGIGDAIRADPSKEKVYFTNVDLTDWDRKVTRIVKPVVNWPDAAQQWVGEPVAFLSAQVGYPNAQGALQWDGHVFNPVDGPGAQWNTAVAMKQQSDVTNAPAGWTPDKMFVKRQIHFTEPPSPLENPLVRIQVEQNIVDLDAQDIGTAENDITLEIRVEEAGTLSVGPIILGAQLTDNTQYVEVTLQAEGNTDAGPPRDPVKFAFEFADQTGPRYWMVYTGQKTFVPKFKYQVHVVVKGTLFSHGQEWTGPWVENGGSGPLMISVPTPTDPDVTAKDMPLSAFVAPSPDGGATSPPVTTGPTAPPSTGRPTPTHAGAATGTPPPATPQKGTVGGWSAAPPGPSKAMPGQATGTVDFTGFEPAQSGG